MSGTNLLTHDDGDQADCKSCEQLLRRPKNAMPLQPMGFDDDEDLRHYLKTGEAP